MREPHGIPSPYYHSCIVCLTICLTVMPSFANIAEVSTTDHSFKTKNLTLISRHVVRRSNTARYIMWVENTTFRTFRIHGPKLIKIDALTNWDAMAIVRELNQWPEEQRLPQGWHKDKATVRKTTKYPAFTITDLPVPIAAETNGARWYHSAALIQDIGRRFTANKNERLETTYHQQSFSR